MDDVVEIRSRTLVGLGRILANYWLLLSSETINSFMEPIIKEFFLSYWLKFYFIDLTDNQLL